MRGSRNFRQWGSRSVWQKSSDNVFFCFFCFFCLVLSLFYSSQMVNFKEIYHFSRFQRGSIIFQGVGGPTFSRRGVQLLIPYRNPYNLWFSRGVRTPCPTSGSALVWPENTTLTFYRATHDTTNDNSDITFRTHQKLSNQLRLPQRTSYKLISVITGIKYFIYCCKCLHLFLSVYICISFADVLRYTLFNPFKQDGISHYCQLEQSISNFRGVVWYFCHFSKF